MAAQLKATVYVADPDTHQTVELAAGTLPELRLAALVTNPAAWVDGKLPRLPKAKTSDQEGGAGDPTGDGLDGAAGGDPDSFDGADAEPPKPAARKAATKPARGRTTAAEGTGGQ